MTTQNSSAATSQPEQPDYFTRVKWHVQTAADRALRGKADIVAVLAKAEARLKGLEGRDAEKRAEEQRIQRLKVFDDVTDQLVREIQAQARNYAASLPRENTQAARADAWKLCQLVEQTALRVWEHRENALDA
ncbi:hypothetical protein NL30_36325 [Burkholderia contaminans]|uniref:hypothetical protein n=1 Tax=Burkholderia contaminans TaxID=488447 RepID=UPI00064A39BE|nr:hypothetical protein [Burkholderia contaminans]AKM45311.1 hypothetical protein NL30_36325 [Burkholderia contaminans]